MFIYSGGECGTGWILDYVLPVEQQEYPTTWFIATDAHVANSIYFDEDNPYKQPLPNPVVDMQCPDELMDAGVTLVKEKTEVRKRDFDRTLWEGRNRVFKYFTNGNGENDVSIWRDADPERSSSVWWFNVKRPKLVYVPYRYLGKGRDKWSGKNNFPDDNYTADFAVFEINFESERVAKLFTRDFYNKYDHRVGSRRDKAINFFAKPIAEEYSNKDLVERDMHVFGVGYTFNGMEKKATSNYDILTNEASRFCFYGEGGDIRDGNREEIVGHENLWAITEPEYGGGATWLWNGKTMHQRGYGYVLSDNLLMEGASGSIWVDEDGNALGTLSMSSDSDFWVAAIISPFRNKEFRDGDGNILYPKYDLLEGVEGQEGSYRDQIKEYFLSMGKDTALSRLRGW